jgi:hypothetical protein
MPTIENSLLTLKGTPLGAQAGRRTAGALVILTLASVSLSACGGGSSGKASSANAAAKGASTTATAPPTTTSAGSTSTSAPNTGTPATAQSKLRACLQKNGVNLPPPTSGAATTHGSSGVPTATLQAALKKCYTRPIVPFAGPKRRPASPAIQNPAFKAALGQFATCLRQKGLNVPAPNTSGNGPILSTKGINTRSPQFASATKACRSVLVGAFRKLRPGAEAAHARSTPPAAGQTPGG